MSTSGASTFNPDAALAQFSLSDNGGTIVPPKKLSQLLNPRSKVRDPVRELHNCGVVHRDLAMRNIYDKGRIYLLDFKRSVCTRDHTLQEHNWAYLNAWDDDGAMDVEEGACDE